MLGGGSILLHLDFADEDVHSDHEILEAAGEEALAIPPVRASQLGAPRSPSGSPQDWDAAADVVLRMARRVAVAGRKLEKTPRTIVAGRAGLPLFALLGTALSARHPDMVLVNRRKDNPHWDRISLGRPPASEEPAFFEVRSGFEPSDSPGRVAVVVSTSAPRGPGAGRLFLSGQGEAIAGEVEIRALGDVARGPQKWLTGENASQAAAELIDLFAQLPSLFPKAHGFALFIDGPVTLAYLVGRALVLRLPLHCDVWIPNFQLGAYHHAIRLPYRPRLRVLIVHHPADQPLAERMQKTLRAERPRFFDRSRVLPGDEIAVTLQQNVDSADIVTVLLSPDLLHDDGLCDLVDRALARLDDARTRVVPVRGRPCQWERGLPRLAARQATPAGDRWVMTADNDELWNEVDRDLYKVVEEVRAEVFGDDRNPQAKK